MPFGFTPERTRWNIGHCVLVPCDVQGSDRTDFVKVEPKREDAEELFSHQAGPTGHAVHPADSGAVIAKEGYPFFSKGSTDVFHHEP